MNFKTYTNFRKNYNFVMPELVEKDGCIYLNNEIVEDTDKKYSEGNGFINILYNSKVSKSKVLSNLYPMQFKFRGKMVASIESVLQAIKYKDIKTQNLVLKYSGIDAYHTRACNETDFWGKNGILYWQGKSMDRHSDEYQNFIDELYFSVLKNPLYVRALLSTEDKYLLHHIGKNNPNETVLTRFELENRLNSLREFIKNSDILTK